LRDPTIDYFVNRRFRELISAFASPFIEGLKNRIHLGLITVFPFLLTRGESVWRVSSLHGSRWQTNRLWVRFITILQPKS
jgi:hypothetical protein